MSVVEQITDQIEGAQILSAHVDEEEGMHIFLSNGLVIIFLGAIGLMRINNERLH